MGTGGNFDEKLSVADGPDKKADGVTPVKVVMAGGPLDPSVLRVIDLCVWVIQRADATVDDAIAQGMGPEVPPPLEMPDCDDPVTVVDKGKPVAHWKMDLKDRQETQEVDFVAGSATAVAIGAFLVNTPTGEKRRVLVWSEAVELDVQPGAVSA
jgi:hypothetical protein